MLSRLRRLFGRDNSKEKREDQYGAGQDAAAEIFKKYPEKLAYERIAYLAQGHNTLYAKGLIDYAEEYRLLQKGIQQ